MSISIYKIILFFMHNYVNLRYLNFKIRCFTKEIKWMLEKCEFACLRVAKEWYIYTYYNKYLLEKLLNGSILIRLVFIFSSFKL